jgi:hypothetical protein
MGTKLYQIMSQSPPELSPNCGSMLRFCLTEATMSKGLTASLVAVPALLLVTWILPLRAQSSECPIGEALLSQSNPVYADAIELEQSLQNHGFSVRCIFPTTLNSIFMVEENGTLQSTIEGEVCYRTNYGDLSVVFVAKPQTFADFKIAEHCEGGSYLYRFTGTTRVWSGNKFKFGSAHRIYFLKRDNQLFLADNQLISRLQDAFHLPPQMP